MDPSLPPDILAELNGTHVGLLGFEPESALRTSNALAGYGAVTRIMDALRHTDRRLDVFLVNVRDDESGVPEGLLESAQPWLLTGSERAILRNSFLRSHAEDVIFPPGSDREIAYRVARLRHRRPGRQLPASPNRMSLIVIADDDFAMRGLLKAILAPYPVECVMAKDGLETLNAIRDLLPDLVLLDINMPVMNGMDVLGSIRTDAAMGATKVILLTASRELEHLHAGAELKADGYICKPIDHMMLMRRIRQMLPTAFRHAA